MTRGTPILEVEGIDLHFGGVKAVDRATFAVASGSITALIGPNGAGKTTFFNLLTGFDRADAGQWTFDGQRLDGRRPDQVARAGMVRTFQLTKSLPLLTVLENVKLAATEQRGERFLPALWPPAWRRQEAELVRRADALLERFMLGRMRDELAGTLSGGQRKLLDVVRVLMMEPKLVMLDEPMAGVNPALTQSLLVHIRSLTDDGMSVLFVEHDMDVVAEISDWVVCMAQGSVIAEGRPAAIMHNPTVIDAYLGGGHDEAATADAEQGPGH